MMQDVPQQLEVWRDAVGIFNSFCGGGCLHRRPLHADRRGGDPDHRLGIPPLRCHLRRRRRMGLERLDDHIRRFRTSMQKFRFNPKESDDDIKAVLHRCVALSGLRNAYVAMDCLRDVRPPASPITRSTPATISRLLLFPGVWVMSSEYAGPRRSVHHRRDTPDPAELGRPDREELPSG